MRRVAVTGRYTSPELVFRLVYTALYLTTVVLDVLAIIEQPRPRYVRQLVFYGWNFIDMSVWDTFCLWGTEVWERLKFCLRSPNGSKNFTIP